MTADIKNISGSRSLVSNCELFIYGPIDSYAFEGEGVRAIDVIDSLSQISASSVTVRVNSPGGSVTEGIAIYNALKADGRNIVVKVDAMAASIASVIAMAGNQIVMAENASLMIHDPWSVAVGSSGDMRKMADEIDRMKNIILNIYADRTGMSVNEIAAMMASETYMDAAQAVEFGFATSVDMPMKIAASIVDKDMLRRLIFNSIETKESSEQSSPDETAAPATKEEEDEMSESNTAGVEPVIEETVETPVVENHVDAIVTDAIKNERSKNSKIISACVVNKVGADYADKLIQSGVTLDKALELITDKVAEMNDKSSGGDIINVIRDEGVVRASAIEEALTIRFSGEGSPSSDAVRNYMGYSLVDIAAELTGHRGPARSPAVKERIMFTAMQNSGGMHTRSDMPLLLENAMNKALKQRYLLESPTYRSIAQQRTYSDFRPHNSYRVGDFPMLEEVNEAGEIKAGTFSETRETTSVKAYGKQIGFSRQSLVDDNLGGIQQVLSSRAAMVAAFEDKTFFEMMISNTLAGPTLNETSRGVFNTTDKTKASSGTVIDGTNMALARAEFRKKTSLDGMKLNISPAILLVGPDKEYQAQQLVAPINAAVTSNVNPFSGSMQVVVSSYISGNAWYLFANPTAGANFEWGLLAGYEAPRFRMDDPFGQQGMRVSLEHDFGCGAIDFRFGYLNTGA